MKILILGSEGFIGKHAVKELGLLGYEVFSADITLKEVPSYFVINPEAANFSDLFLNQEFDVCLNATGGITISKPEETEAAANWLWDTKHENAPLLLQVMIDPHTNT
jgi:nucleoside-diphosphate-sugar epimerase